jgi:hypothetical protein
MRIARCLFIAAIGLALAPSAARAGSAFDGQWNVVLTCPPHYGEDDAKGYVHRFPAEIKDGLLRGTYGIEGQPGWLVLTGPVAPDGRADLQVDGIVKNADYAVNHAQAGKPYSYRVRTKFEAASGTGVRVGKRKCDFAFKHK